MPNATKILGQILWLSYNSEVTWAARYHAVISPRVRGCASASAPGSVGRKPSRHVRLPGVDGRKPSRHVHLPDVRCANCPGTSACARVCPAPVAANRPNASAGARVRPASLSQTVPTRLPAPACAPASTPAAVSQTARLWASGHISGADREGFGPDVENVAREWRCRYVVPQPFVISGRWPRITFVWRPGGRGRWRPRA